MLMVITMAVLLTGCTSVTTTTTTTRATTSASTSETTVTTAPPVTETTAATTTTTGKVVVNPVAGKAYYKANCATCHGPDGHAGAGYRGVDLKNAVTDPAADVVTAIAEGVPPGMPAWKTFLSAAAIGDIVAWIQGGMK
jgi:mono/diheme cytochrome c family protein